MQPGRVGAGVRQALAQAGKLGVRRRLALPPPGTLGLDLGVQPLQLLRGGVALSVRPGQRCAQLIGSQLIALDRRDNDLPDRRAQG